MLHDCTSTACEVPCPWRGDAFIVPPGVPLGALNQRRRRRPSSNERLKCNDRFHAVPLPSSCSTPSDSPWTPRDHVGACRSRPRTSWSAISRVGVGETDGSWAHSRRRGRGSLSSAATVELGGGGGGVGAVAVDFGGSGSSSGSSSGVFEEVGVSRDGGNTVSVSVSHVDDIDVEEDEQEEEHQREEQFVLGEQQQQQGGDAIGEEANVAGPRLGVGTDAYSRQLIGGLTKLSRSGLWKASFKVLRVEQALNARKASIAQENGQEYSSSWPVVEPKAYNTILAALSRAEKWEEAVLLLKEMETRGIHRDAVSYACLITACGRGKQWKKALSALHEMRDLGIKPNSFVYSAAIDACAKGRQWQKALVLLRDMEEVDGLPPNLICYNSAADACSKAGRPGEALALLSKMRKVGIRPNEVSYLSVISACSRMGDWKQALMLLDEMIVYGVNPDLKCYCSAITACGKGGKWKEALELVDAMHKDGPPPNDYCYNAAISACGKSGQWHRSKELLSIMRERGVPPDLISFNSAIDACGKSGRWDEGLKIFVDMVKASEEPWNPSMDHPKPPTPDATTYGAIITACSRGKQWQMALRFLEDMEKKGVERTEGVFQATLAGCARVGRWRECIVTLDQMRKNGLQPRAAAYNSVITACGRGGEWQRAIAILQQMSSRGATPDVITLNAAMTACTQARRWKHAKAILDFMRDPTSVPITECGGLPFPTLNIGSASDDLMTEKVPGNGRVNGDPPALRFGDRAPAAATTARRTGIVANAPAISSDTSATFGTGKGADGSRLLQRWTTAEGVWPPRPDAFSFHTVMKALATAGMWEDAVEILEGMVDERRQFLKSNEALQETTGGASQQWPVNIERFRSVFQLEVRNNEIVGHERGCSEFDANDVSPEVSVRAKAMDILMAMETEEKEARLKRQALYDTITRR
ncbi:unnamed protein product [Scytosiphon promiscuus]